MDGGGLAMGSKGEVGATWRRENSVYYAEPGMPEQKIADGRASTLAKSSNGNYIFWQQGNQILSKAPDKITADILGTGIYPRAVTLADDKIFCVWESEGKIVARLLP